MFILFLNRGSFTSIDIVIYNTFIYKKMHLGDNFESTENCNGRLYGRGVYTPEMLQACTLIVGYTHPLSYRIFCYRVATMCIFLSSVKRATPIL